MDFFTEDTNRRGSLLDQQLAEVLAPLGFEQERESQTDEPVMEKLHLLTYYQQILCDLPRRLMVLAEVISFLVSQQQQGFSCVSQGNTKQGRGCIILASQYPFPESLQEWLAQHPGLDSYQHSVSIDIDLKSE